ncbi:MAG: NAD(P)(+) transhydrogenase (Re/Si-specific) subunit alpha, partial [Pseudomonadota bacterium]
MKIAVLKATEDARGAVTPDSLKKLQGLGADIAIEKGAGKQAGFSSDAYTAAGAKVGDAAEVLSGADVVLVA